MRLPNPLHRSHPAASLGVLLLSLASSAHPRVEGAEWTHYRGPTHDGVYDGPFQTDWDARPPRLLWRKPASPALSSLTISAGRAFTQGRRAVAGSDREFAIALNAATGEELWAVNLDQAEYPNGGVGDDDGPRSTPVVDGDHVYVLSSYLRLYCLEAATGHVVWQRNFPSEFSSAVIPWQNAASPLIVGDLVILNSNAGSTRLIAVRKSDGVTAWRRQNESMTQSTPVLAEVAGITQVIFHAQSGLVSVRPETGDLLWRFALPYSTSTAASPVVDGNLVYGSAAYSSGSGVVSLAAGGGGSTITATSRWTRRSFNMNHWATAIAHLGHIYSVAGQDSTSLRCIDTAAGTENWRTSSVGTGDVGYGSVLKAGGALLVLTASGEAVLAELTPTGYHELTHLQVVEGRTWNSPALDDGVLYARSTTEIAAWRIAEPTPGAPLTLTPAVTVANGKAIVVVRSNDGTPITASRAARISLLATEDPSQPIALWRSIVTPPRLVDGNVQLDDPAATVPFRTYRTAEKP